MSIVIDKTHPIGKLYYTKTIQSLEPGKATTVRENLVDNIGEIQKFENGWIIYHPNHGAHFLPLKAAGIWLFTGGPQGSLGYPKTSEILLGGSVLKGHKEKGFKQAEFERGIIMRNASVFAMSNDYFESHGLIYQKYKELDKFGEEGMGLLLSNELPMPDKMGRYNIFRNGWIYWHPNYGTFPVKKGIIGYAHALTVNTLGYPTGNKKRIKKDNGFAFINDEEVYEMQNFSNGTIKYYPETKEIIAKTKTGQVINPYYRNFEVSMAKSSISTSKVQGKIIVEFAPVNGQKISKTIFDTKGQAIFANRFEHTPPGEGIVHHTFSEDELIKTLDFQKAPSINIVGRINGQKINKQYSLAYLYENGRLKVPIGNGYMGYLMLEIKPGAQALSNYAAVADVIRSMSIPQVESNTTIGELKILQLTDED